MVFTEPMAQIEPSARGWPSTFFKASSSIGSPSDVPASAGETPALSSACRSSACCASTLGAVSPVERPSWLIAEPRMTAQTRSPSRCASESRLTTPQPSART
ncbi:hypothetical protein BE20_23995 [Sorangium cellulosum]|nr:hypothetical protein BE20_23995 [Sorangium cellulosum]